MMRALCSAAFVALLLQPAGAMAQSSQFKGWAAVSRELSIRLAPQGHPFDLDEFLPSGSMDELLGTWTTFGTEHRFRNGTQMCVAVIQFAPGIADSDYGTVLKNVRREAFGTKPRTARKIVIFLARPPLLATQFPG